MNKNSKGSKRNRGSLTYPVAFSREDFLVGRSFEYDLITLKRGGLTDRVGWPALPFAVKYFVLPDNVRNVSVSLLGPKWASLPGRYTLVPVQPPRPAAPDNHERPARFPLPPMQGVEYRRTSPFYPLDPQVSRIREISLSGAELSTLDSYAGRGMAAVRIYPLRYNPSKGTVRYLASATLKIDFERLRRGDIERVRSPLALGVEMKKLISLIENPQDVCFRVPKEIAGFDEISPVCPADLLRAPKPKSRQVFPFVEDKRVFIPPDILMPASPADWPYVIITDDYEWAENGTKGSHAGNLIAEFEELARWKTMKGLRTRVVPVTEIMANRFGTHWATGVTRDVPEAIRNFLKFTFQHWNTQWCLLGGDINIVPVRHVLGNMGWYHIEKKDEPTPEPNKMYHDAATNSLRYRSEFDFTTDDVFFAVETAEVIRYLANADAAHPGWYWTQADYTTKSAIPTRHIVIRASGTLLGRTFTVPQYINMIPTDLYYASLDSPLYSQPGRHDWDNDGNGFYGWWDGGNPDGIDFTADISVGRVPARDTQSARDYVDKVLTYERFTDTRTGEPLSFDHTRRLCCVAGTWGSGWYDGSFDKLRWAELDGACQDKENVIALLRDIAEVDLIRRFYEDIYFVRQIESNLSVNDSAHVPDLRAAVNQGPHFLSVSGHGWWGGTAGFSSTDPNWVHVEGMTNWPRFAIYFVDSCLTNEFDLDLWTAYNRVGGAQAGDPNQVCFGKKVVRWGNGGAIGYVGYARLGVVGWSQEIPFWEALSQPGQARLGKMLDRSREIGKDRVGKWQVYIMNLMGDPELPVFWETPQLLTVSHCSVVYGRDHLVVRVFHEEQPMSNVRVSVCQMSDTDPTDKVCFRQVWAAYGYYAFDTSSARNGKLHVVVTGDNFVPYVGEAQKVSEPVSAWKYRISWGFVYDIVGKSSSAIYAAADKYLMAMSAGSNYPEWYRALNGTVQDLVSSADGTVLAGVRKQVNDNLILMDRTGTQLRSWSLPQEVYAIEWDVNARAAYAALRDKGMHSYNTATGALRWKREDLGTCHFVQNDGGGRVYATTTAEGIKLTCLAKSGGATLWSYDVGPSWEWGPVALLVAEDGTAYVATRNRELHVVDPDGNQVWKKTGLSASAISLALWGDHVYVGRGDGTIAAYTQSNGAVTWQRDIGDRIECFLVGPDGAIYVGSWHGVHSLEPSTGTTRWFRETMGAVLSLALVGNVLYAGSRDGWVYAIDIRPFVGNSRTKELHFHDCQWVARMSGENKVHFHSIAEALSEGYNGCYYCLHDYDTG